MERNFTEWPLGSTDQGATLSIYRANQTRSNAVIMCPGYCRYGCNFVPWNGPRRFPDSALSGDQHDGPTDTFALAMQNVRREYSRSRKKGALA